MNYHLLNKSINIAVTSHPLFAVQCTEPEFENVEGAQESIQGIESASLCSLAARYRPARLGFDSYRLLKGIDRSFKKRGESGLI